MMKYLLVLQTLIVSLESVTEHTNAPFNLFLFIVVYFVVILLVGDIGFEPICIE